nr:hypothetical protein [Tanacetum cinerariifolium]
MSFSKRPGKNTPKCYTKPLNSLKNWNNHFFWVDERVFPTVVDWRTNALKDGMPAENTYSVEGPRALDTHHMDLFNLIRAQNPTKVKIGSRPRAPHEVPLLTLTANRVIEMDDPAAATDSSSIQSTIERSPLDFAHEAGTSDQGTVTPEISPFEDVPATDAPRAGQAEEVAATDPPAATVAMRPIKSLAAIQLGLASTHPVHVPENAPAGVSDPDPLSFADPQSRHPADITQSSQGTEQQETQILSMPLPLSRPEAKLLRKSVAQVARRDKRIQARELEIKNMEALLEAEADMKKAAEDRSAGLSQELEDMRARFSDLQVSNERLSQQVATLQEQVSGEEKLKAAFEEFKRSPMVIGHGLRLAVMKCDESLELRQAFADVVSAGIAKGISEGLRHGVEHGQAQLSLESLEAYDPKAEAKYVAALQALKDLKYPLVDQLEGMKDAPMDVIMAALYLKSDTGDDAPQYIRDLHPSSSQLTIPVYLEVRDPRNPWAYKEEMLLADAIAENISRAEKKKKCRIVCRTHRVGSAHHARFDGVSIKNPEALLEAEADMKKATEDMSVGLSQELEDMLARFSDLPAFADVVSVGIAKGMSEGLRHRVEHGQAQLSLESIKSYDPEAKAKYVAAL